MPAAVWLLALLAILTHFVLKWIIHRRRRKSTRRLTGKSLQVVCVINTDLKMSKGKVLSQFGHGIDGIRDVAIGYEDRLQAWFESGRAKIALKGTQEELGRVYRAAREASLPYYRVFDAGKTQIPTGSFTCVAVGPATKEELAGISGELALY